MSQQIQLCWGGSSCCDPTGKIFIWRPCWLQPKPLASSGTKLPLGQQGQHGASTGCFSVFVLVPLWRPHGPNCPGKVPSLVSPSPAPPAASTPSMVAQLGRRAAEHTGPHLSWAPRASSHLKWAVSPGLYLFC